MAGGRVSNGLTSFSPVCFLVIFAELLSQPQLNYKEQKLSIDHTPLHLAAKGTIQTSFNVRRTKSRAKCFLSSRLLYSSNGMCAFQLERSILAVDMSLQILVLEESLIQSILAENVVRPLDKIKSPSCVLYVRNGSMHSHGREAGFGVGGLKRTR